MGHDRTEEALELHHTLEFIGLRAHATTVGLLQLSAELVKAGVLNDDAIQNIKDAIHKEITVSRPRSYDRAEFSETLRQRLDAIFPRDGNAERSTNVGTLEDMEHALVPHGEEDQQPPAI